MYYFFRTNPKQGNKTFLVEPDWARDTYFELNRWEQHQAKMPHGAQEAFEKGTCLGHKASHSIWGEILSERELFLKILDGGIEKMRFADD